MGKGKKNEKLEELQEKVMDSAQKVWLAGLGALAVAEEEGSKLFKELVKRGESMEGEIKGELTSLRKEIAALVERGRGQASKVVEQVETNWDEKLTQALSRLGVPTRDEIAALAARVEELTRKLDERAAEGAKKPRSRAEVAAPAATE
jgi:poly(hydroxyalkanoate) granule-associated protein